MFFPPENRSVYEIMWKYILKPGRPQMTIWRMRIACWITKGTTIHSEYVTIVAFTLKQWLHERISVLRFTYISRLVDQAQRYPRRGVECRKRPCSLSSCTVTIFWNESYPKPLHVLTSIWERNTKSFLVTIFWNETYPKPLHVLTSIWECNTKSFLVTIFWNETYPKPLHVLTSIWEPNARSCLVDAAVQHVTSSGIRKETFLPGPWE